MSTRLDKWNKEMQARKGSRQGFKFWLNWDKAEDVELIETIALLMDNSQFSEVIRKALRIIPALMEGELNELFDEFPWVKAEFLEYMRELKEPDDNSGDEDIETEKKRIEQERQWLEAEQQRLEAEREWHQRKLEEERQRMEQERNQNQSAIQKQLQRLEELLLQQGNVPVQSTQQTVAPERLSEGVGLKDNPASDIGLKGAGLKSGGLGGNFAAPPPVFDDDDLPELIIQKSKTSGTSANQNLINGLLGLQQ